MKDELFCRAIPRAIINTCSSDVLQQRIRVKDSLGGVGSVLLQFPVDTLSIERTFVLADDSFAFVGSENVNKDSIQVLLLFTEQHLVVIRLRLEVAI